MFFILSLPHLVEPFGGWCILNVYFETLFWHFLLIYSLFLHIQKKKYIYIYTLSFFNRKKENILKNTNMGSYLSIQQTLQKEKWKGKLICPISYQ